MHLSVLRIARWRAVLLTVVIMHPDAAVARRPSDTSQGTPLNRYMRLWIGMPSCVPVVTQIYLFGVLFAPEEEIMWFDVAVDKAARVDVPHYIQLQ